METQPHPLLQADWQQPQSWGAGLQNLGNTCYMNATLQCLAYCPPFGQLALQRWHSRGCRGVSCAAQPRRPGLYGGSSGSMVGGGSQAAAAPCCACMLEEQLRSLLTSRGSLSAWKLQQHLPSFSRSFVRGRQEDSHEYLLALMDALDRELRPLSKPPAQLPGSAVAAAGTGAPGGQQPLQAQPITLVDELFGGQLQSQLVCGQCGHVSNTMEPFGTLSLDIGCGVGSLEQALRAFTAAETLGGDNAWRCEGCKRLVSASKRTTVAEEPNILVVHLKRFSGILGGKISRHISFEPTLDLAPFLTPRAAAAPPPPAAAAAAAAAGKQRPCTYSLTGIVVHEGLGAHSGHYYAYVRDSAGRWACCNDSSVYAVRLDTVLAQAAYLLVYVRQGMKKKQPVMVAPAPAAAAKPSSTAQQQPARQAGRQYGPQLPEAQQLPGRFIGPQLPPAAATADAAEARSSSSSSSSLPSTTTQIAGTATTRLLPRALDAAVAGSQRQPLAAMQQQQAQPPKLAAGEGANAPQPGPQISSSLANGPGAAAGSSQPGACASLLPPQAAVAAAAEAGSGQAGSRKRGSWEGRDAEADAQALAASARCRAGVQALRRDLLDRLRGSKWAAQVRARCVAAQQEGRPISEVMADAALRQGLRRLVPQAFIQIGLQELQQLFADGQ